MNIRKLFGYAVKAAGSKAKHAKPVINSLDYFSTHYQGITPAVKMKTLLEYYNTCYMFGAAVDLHAAMAVGNSFRIVVNPPDEKDIDLANECKQEIEKIFDDMHMDRIFHEMATSMFAFGNWFGTPLHHEGEKMDTVWSGLRTVPIDSMVGIKQDIDGSIMGYTQLPTYGFTATSASGYNDIQTNEMMHFSRNNLNGSPWGRGIGQRAAFKGVGYDLPNGNKDYRPSLFEVLEMVDSVSIKLYMAGVPRYVAMLESSDEKLVDDANEILDTLAPAEHIALNAKGKIETIGLDTANRFSDILKHIRDNVTMCFLNPSFTLWTNPTFSYASSQTSMESMTPLIKGYERDHKRFVERNIIKPIIEHEFGPDTWELIGLELMWEEPVTFMMQQLQDIMPVLESSLMKRWIKHEDMFEIVNKLGWTLSPKEEDELEPIPTFQPGMPPGEPGNAEEEDTSVPAPGEMEAEEMLKSKRMKLESQKQQASIREAKARTAAYEAISEWRKGKK